jgi:hypothetical protein
MIDRPAASDALFDTSSRAMAARFGELAIRQLETGRDPREAARLAASYGARVLLEEEPIVLPFYARFGGVQ